jgi:hypothetical protein
MRLADVQGQSVVDVPFEMRTTDSHPALDPHGAGTTGSSSRRAKLRRQRAAQLIPPGLGGVSPHENGY